MIETRSLTKRFGTTTAVDSMSFQVGTGEIVGFLGPNGAGKSTTMRMITGFLPPTSGEALVNGKPVWEDPLETRRAIGYLPESNPLYEDLRVHEYLRFRASLKGVPRKRRRNRIEEVMESCEISDVRHRIIGTCSKGYRQRIGLADALLADPPALILDEPTVGLDPAQIVHTRSLIKNLAREHTVLLSTHILPEVEAICSRTIIIHKGRLQFDGTVEELQKGLSGGGMLTCTVRGDAEKARNSLLKTEGVEDVDFLGGEEDQSRFRVTAQAGRDAREAIFWTCSKEGMPLLELVSRQISLEEAFLSLTTRESAAEKTEEEQP
ncbi:MAG: ATP-binding cassette domain-containing protein [Acidobacteriota bacterium]|jgi:ABC-2 type transport system ATP-binding protein